MMTLNDFRVQRVNITATLDHLDYDCILVAGSVHVLGQCVKWSFRHDDQSILSLPVCLWNEFIPQSVPRFTVGHSTSLVQ